MRVAVYAIALNEARHVARFLHGCTGADLAIVADTGSTDDTVALLQEGDAVVHSIAIRPWRFDSARNAALALVPADVDVCIALDLDEVLSPGWRAALEAGWGPGTTRAQYSYVNSHRPDGSVAVEMLGDKIHARWGYRWRHLCHEALYPDRIQQRHVTLPDLRVDHWPDLGKARSQYLPMLEAAVAEDPGSLRDAFMLGREYVMLRQWEKGEATLQRYLDRPDARWKPQVAAAMRHIARCRVGLDDLEGAAAWLLRAVDALPDARDAWVDLADIRRRQRDWSASLDAALRALAIARTPGRVANDPRSAGARPHDIASLAAYQLGRYADAVHHAEAATALDPWDERLQANLLTLRRRYEAALA